jgi:guanidinobutyrase
MHLRHALRCGKYLCGFLLPAFCLQSAIAGEAPARPVSAADYVTAAQRQYDVGTPAGLHMLGPLSPEIGPPNNSVVVLDPADPNLDLWKRREAQIDLKRAPGPWSAAGALSFFGLPVAMTPADLKAGKVDVAIVGAALDTGTVMRGAGEGPRAVRGSRGGAGMNIETMLNWSAELKAVDYGDVPIDNLSVERSVFPVRRLVREIAQTGAVPVIIGGDHSLEYPDVVAMSEVYGKENLQVMHIDAHPDNGDQSQAHLIWFGNMVRRLVDDGWVLGENYIEVGLRSAQASMFEWQRKNKIRYHTRPEIERLGWPEMTNRILAEVSAGPKNVYFSFDLDVFEPAYMSGVGVPAVGGVVPQDIFPLIRRLCAEHNVVGFEVVELDPLLDASYRSVMNAKEIVNQCLSGMALRKKGITEKNYIHPMIADDGVP